jgi:carboxymethylenebutenolidase
MKQITKEDIKKYLTCTMTTHITKLTAEFCRKIIIICCGHAYTAFPTEFYDANYADAILIKPEDPRIKSDLSRMILPKVAVQLKDFVSQPTATESTRNYCGA